jgi:predicted dehydrogenase
MKSLVVGGGSIGKRHLRNLKALGVTDLALVEVESATRAAVSEEIQTAAFASLEEGLGWSPDFVVLATPTYLHLQQAMCVVQAGIPLFVEKPLSHSSEGLRDLVAKVEQQRLVTLVGCNMRFHPGPAKVKELLLDKRIGPILFGRVCAGHHLSRWRPGTDYRHNYAAREATGGGCLLDCVHEIDLARWYLGEIVDVFCAAGHFSSLDIETEDIAALTCRHQSGCISHIHLDYVQQTYERGCRIVGERGSILWDFNEKQVRWYDACTEQWGVFEQEPSWQLNQMYVDEMQHFLTCVQERKQTALPISDACAVMQVVFAAKASARERRSMATRAGVEAWS